MENADILLALNTANDNANTLVTVLGKCKMTLNTQCSRESSIRYQVFSRVCTQFPQSTDLDLNSHKNHQTGIFSATCIHTLFQLAI